MSTSSLWVLDNKLVGNKEVGFRDSLLYPPTALDVLFHKYMPSRRFNAIGTKTNYIIETMFDESLFANLNKLINSSDVIEDRIIWEMCNQQVFFSKDKEFIANCIIKFLDINKDFMYEYQDHIFDRFREIANAIKNIDDTKHIYFVFKNSRCDDVKCWFERYIEETDEYESTSLLDLDKYVTEFVVIENERIVEFIGNIYFEI